MRTMQTLQQSEGEAPEWISSNGIGFPYEYQDRMMSIGDEDMDDEKMLGGKPLTEEEVT